MRVNRELKVAPSVGDLQLDPRFHLDFKTAFATGPSRPQAVAFR